ncbi:MAG: hypothetical protein COX30_04065 [Candidatus Moranbacteria bacterium CG23_combo_of_CG06-09_8_20_14_all_39_10]|nr:MAG: hypothetical protein COX30_04065 [Candidatus Moranbacteria bacterium CG23_combo_of_CG06-09_8_20_14_all_39_10]
MREIFIRLLVIAYAMEGVISAVAYWPTIKDLLAGKKSANVTSYFIWTISSGIAFLYSLFILPDFLFQIVSGIGFSACATVLILGLKFKK